ncbi:MAG: succinate dehydrogenase assembly factor 2 [Halorhodospira sp.]
MSLEGADAGTAAAARRRLRWRCRRGTKELDLLLERFLAVGFEALDAEGRAAFERLLALEDHLLQDWLINGQLPTDRELRWIVERIRRTELSPPP